MLWPTVSSKSAFIFKHKGDFLDQTAANAKELIPQSGRGRQEDHFHCGDNDKVNVVIVAQVVQAQLRRHTATVLALPAQFLEQNQKHCDQVQGEAQKQQHLFDKIGRK